MDPNRVSHDLIAEPVGDLAQSLAQAGAVLAVAQHFQQPPGRAHHQRQ